jgi:hypothetical protein
MEKKVQKALEQTFTVLHKAAAAAAPPTPPSCSAPAAGGCSISICCARVFSAVGERVAPRHAITMPPNSSSSSNDPSLQPGHGLEVFPFQQQHSQALTVQAGNARAAARGHCQHQQVKLLPKSHNLSLKERANVQMCKCHVFVRPERLFRKHDIADHPPTHQTTVTSALLQRLFCL